MDKLLNNMTDMQRSTIGDILSPVGNDGGELRP